MKQRLLKTAGLAILLSTGSYAGAQSSDGTTGLASASMADPAFAQFAPKQDRIDTRIDYAIWNEALEYFVFRMGKSLREGSSRPASSLGTRAVYGHDSLYRMEGNRVAFLFLNDEVKQSLSDYRADLERTADLVDIATLSKNEQLAYWINLHNAAVIEQIALAYPVKQPRQIKLGDGSLPFDETPFITVKGVQMSPKDIRTKIVFPNWRDPKVMYGFFRGAIGGPSIQTEAFTGDNVGDLLDRSAREFVNSLRGVQKIGSTLQVSKIYDEARPYLLADWPTDLRTHLAVYGEDDVKSILADTTKERATTYEEDISDLGKGGYDPSYGFVTSSVDEGGNKPTSTRIPASIQRLLRERAEKVNKLIKRKELTGRVILLDLDLPGEDEKADEVE